MGVGMTTGYDTHSTSQLCRLPLGRQGVDTMCRNLVRWADCIVLNTPTPTPLFLRWRKLAHSRWRGCTELFNCSVCAGLGLTEFLVLLNLCIGLDPETCWTSGPSHFSLEVSSGSCANRRQCKLVFKYGLCMRRDSYILMLFVDSVHYYVIRLHLQSHGGRWQYYPDAINWFPDNLKKTMAKMELEMAW